LEPNSWNPIFSGGGTGIWTESVILARQVLLLLEAVLQRFFSVQFFWDRVLWTIWLVLALNRSFWSLPLEILGLQGQGSETRFCFLFFCHKDWVGAQQFFCGPGVLTRWFMLAKQNCTTWDTLTSGAHYLSRLTLYFNLPVSAYKCLITCVPCPHAWL
jgi:hypothetical protein